MSHANDILVVDNDRAIVILISEVLSEEGYQVRGAADGAGALAAIVEQQPALLLIDQRMPGLSGIEVAAQLCESSYKNIPIVLMTALSERTWPSLPPGVVARLDKPFDLDVLVACIRQYATGESRHLTDATDLN